MYSRQWFTLGRLTKKNEIKEQFQCWKIFSIVKEFPLIMKTLLYFEFFKSIYKRFMLNERWHLPNQMYFPQQPVTEILEIASSTS